MDLGECVKVHDLALRADYEIASKQQEYFFELDVSGFVIITHITVYQRFQQSYSHSLTGIKERNMRVYRATYV